MHGNHEGQSPDVKLEDLTRDGRYRQAVRWKLPKFARYVAFHLGVAVEEEYLIAALGAVRLRRKQESTKLSPVVSIPREGRRDGLLSIAPYCSSTYVSFASCPRSCPFIGGGGCFADGNVNQLRCTNSLDASAAKIPEEIRRDLIALAEAWKAAVHTLEVHQDGHQGGRDLRLHVAGDVTSVFHAERLADAIVEWEVSRGGQVWTFTHSWRHIPRAAWGSISVLASVETAADAAAAMARGYAVAIVVEKFPRGGRAFSLPELPQISKVKPCPNEAGVLSPFTEQPLTCVECRMCLHDQRLQQQQHAIAFEAHGVDRAAAVESLRRANTSADG